MAPQLSRLPVGTLCPALPGIRPAALRGLDHGAWVPLRHLLPDLDTASALALGRALAPIREQGVMILASGGMTHNLYEFRQSGASAAEYALEFTHWIRQAVTRNDIERLVNYRQLAPHAQRAHPTEEHFLPLLVALGARTDKEIVRVLDGGIDHGVLSMESYAWGVHPIHPANTPNPTVH